MNQKVEFIESYIKNGTGDYQWNGNNGELVRCKDCKHWSAERINDFNKCRRWINVGVENFATTGEWFCADARKVGEESE